MAKHRKIKRPSNEHVDNEALTAHIGSLGLPSVEAYRDWCMQHGFNRKLHKSRSQRQQERAFVQNALSTARLKSERQQRRDPLSALLAICDGQLPLSEVTQGNLQRFGTLVSRNGPHQQG